MTETAEIPVEDAEELITPAEAARVLGIDVRLLQQRANAGKVPVESRSKGGHRRFSAAAIREIARKEAARKASQADRDLAAVAAILIVATLIL